MLRKIGLVLLAAAGAFALAACGDDDEDKAGGKAKTLSVTLNAQNRLQGPTSTEGGLVRLRFTNRSKLPYDLQLIKVDGNQSVQDVLKVVASEEEGQPIPSWIHGAGGVGGTRPGQSETSTQVVEAGKYYLVAGPNDGPNAKPVTASLQVSGGDASAELPKGDATVTARDYAFSTSGLKAGKTTVEFVNSGKELHHVVAAPILPGKTLADVREFVRTEKGRPPIDFNNQASSPVLDGGKKQLIDLDLKPGNYALLCFITDRKGGPPHVAKGMVSEARVSG
jgi:hypothetical protein